MKKITLLILFMGLFSINGISSNDINVSSGDANLGIAIIDDQEVGVPKIIVSETSVGVLEGGMTTYTIVLDTQPTADVIITPTTGNTVIATVSEKIIFTTSNWNTAQTVTVTGIKDAGKILDTTDISHEIETTDARYARLSLSVMVTVYDIDAVGVAFSKTKLSADEGGMDFYTVVLTEEPTEEVIIKVLSTDEDVATTPSVPLTFTTMNWNAAQTVTVTGTDDDDGADAMTEITHRVTSGPANYKSLTIDNVYVNVKDNDEKGITATDVVSDESLTVAEGTSKPSYTIKLNTKPTGDVTIALTSSKAEKLTVSPETLTFTAEDWDTVQKVTITALSDFDADEETVKISHVVSGADYNSGIGTPDKTITVTDDETAGIDLSTTALAVTESKTITYTIALTSQPKKAITITPTSATMAVATVLPATLTFTATNWNTAQTVTVTGIDDSDETADGSPRTSIISHAINSEDGSGYDDVDATAAAAATNTANQVIATVKESGVAGVTVSTATLSLTEGGAAATYTVVLTKLPTASVTITPTLPTGTAEGKGAVTLSPETLVFTTGNWEEPKVFTVTTVGDDNGDDEIFSITHVASDTGGYTDVTVGSVAITVMDDDMAEVTITGTEPTVKEGKTATYTVSLNVQPTGDVIITPTSTSADISIATVSNALTFTATNWNTVQTVTVTAVEDNDAADEMAVITNAITGAGAAAGTSYNGVTASDVTVSVTDDETAVITLYPTKLSVKEGGMVTYTIVLETEPMGDVTITPKSSNSDVTYDEALIFTTTSWNIAQTVTITTSEIEANQEVTISHIVTGSKEYKALTDVDSVTLTVKDSEAAAIIVSPTEFSVGEGKKGTYSIILVKKPTGNVTITPMSSNNDVATISPANLAFTIHNWNTAKLVTISGVQDVDAIDGTVTISHIITASGEYANVTASDVTVIVTDDETAGVTVIATPLLINEGSTTTYTVVLNSKPSASNVNINLEVDKSATVVSLSAAVLAFNASNWNIAQTVTVTAEQDDNAVGEVAIITHLVSSTDSNSEYNSSLSVESVTVTVMDDETAGLTLYSDALAVTEGKTVTYTVKLNSQPSGSVTITPTSAAVATATVSKALTFTTANWNIAQTVTVTGIKDSNSDDDEVDITQVITGADLVYNALMVDDTIVSVKVFDAEGTKVVISKTNLPITEGESETYTMVLNKEPTGTVSVTRTILNGINISPEEKVINFTSSNWNEPQTITVMASEDDDADDETLMIVYTVIPNTYTTPNVITVYITDNDTKGAIISRKTLAIDEGGTAGSYTIKLSSKPSADVTIDVATSSSAVKLTKIPTAGGDPTLLTSLTFTSSNWNTVQTVTVKAVSDASTTDDVATITHTVSADAGGYTTDIVLNNVTVTVRDTTTTIDAGITASSEALNIDEGDSGSYTIVLDSQPTEDVIISFSSDTESIVTTSTPPITFTADNWFNERTIQVSAVNNDVDDALSTKSAIIRHTITGASEYASETIADVTVTVTDDDTAGVSFSKSTLRITEPTDATAIVETYTIVLDTKPMGDVTITPSSANDNVATVTGEALTFTTEDWATPQTVTVTSVKDSNIISDEVNITHTIKGGYLDTVDNVVVTVTDSDSSRPSVTVIVPPSASTGLYVSEDGKGTYTVVLSNKPTEDVTITPSSTDTELATVSGELTFTMANWNIAQKITVTGVQDANSVNDDGVTITHTISGGGYGNSIVNDVPVTVTDDDTAGVTTSTTSFGIREGNTVSYTIVLDTKPVGNVTITPDLTNTGDSYVGVSPSSHTFTPDNWDTPQIFEVNGLLASVSSTVVNDKVITNTITGDVMYVGLGDGGYPTISFEVYDTDTKGIVLSKLKLKITEGNTKTYTIALSQKPSGDVTIKPVPPASNEPGANVVTVSTTSDDNTLTFTPLNWNREQTVTVTGMDDSDAIDDEMAAIKHTATAKATDDVYADLGSIVITVKESPPVITLNGEAIVTITLGSPYVDAGAIAIDNVDGKTQIVGVGTVEVNVIGDNTITYNTVDAAGNRALEVRRTVSVIAEIAENAGSETLTTSNWFGGAITKGKLSHISVVLNKEYASIEYTINSYDGPFSAARASLDVAAIGVTDEGGFLNVNGEEIMFVEGAVRFTDVAIANDDADLTDNNEACPCKVTLRYSSLPAGTRASNIAIYAFDESTEGKGEWKVLATTSPSDSPNTITATTQVFYSVFAVGAKLTQLSVIGKEVIFDAKARTIEIEFNKAIAQRIDLTEVVIHNRVGDIEMLNLDGAAARFVEGNKIVITLLEHQNEEIVNSIKAEGTMGRLAETTRIDIGAGAVQDLANVGNPEITGIGIVVSGTLSNSNFELRGVDADIWPIPTSYNLYINIDEKADYRLLNIRGQVLKVGNLKAGIKNSVDISPLSKGIYLLNIVTTKGSLVRKVVKN